MHGRVLRAQDKLGVFWPLVIGCVMLAAIFAFGIFTYMYVEGWSLFDAVYQVVITLSTVGFQEVNPLTQKGRALTMILIVAGVGTFAYMVGSFTQVLIDGRIQKILGRRKVQKIIDKLSNHTIICGYGRIGAVVAGEIMDEGGDVVIVEMDSDVLSSLEQEGVLHLAGDATADETLLNAGLLRANALVAALHMEAANVYVTLTARQLNPKVHIVARADNKKHIPRLERAGADQVVIPHMYGGVRMAQTVLRPTVTNFLDLASRGAEIELQMEELAVTADSDVVDKNLIETEIRPRFNLIVIGVKKPDGEMIFNPRAQIVLEAGDTMIVVGKPKNLAQLQAIL